MNEDQGRLSRGWDGVTTISLYNGNPYTGEDGLHIDTGSCAPEGRMLESMDE